MLDEIREGDLQSLGRSLAHIHNIGAQKKFKFRTTLAQDQNSVWFALEVLKNFVAPEVWHRYEAAAIVIGDRLENLPISKMTRIHGDLHRGNILKRDRLDSVDGPPFLFVDFDDSLMGLPVQDFWMLMPDPFSEEERQELLAGYTTLRDFDSSQWAWLPWLQGLRIINYAAWIARRWKDPVFPHLFPQFKDYTYWAEETESLERIAWRDQ
jgi:Ser/Thr protein kinase RdoA (MazF antagonist)